MAATSAKPYGASCARTARKAFGRSRSGASTKCRVRARSRKRPFARHCRGVAAPGGYGLGRRKRRLERSAAGLGERAIVVVRVEPAIGDQDVMGMDAPLGGKSGCPCERCGIDETA